MATMASLSEFNPAVVPWQRTLYIISFAQMVTSIGFSSIFPFLPMYVKALGTATSVSIDLLVGLVFSGQAVSMMIASPIWGALADRWGRKIMVERAMYGGALVFILMGFVRSAEELVLLRVVQGVITGTIGAANALVASVVPRERSGYAMGFLSVAMGCGLGIGPIIGGIVADTLGYRSAFFVTAALLAVAGIIISFGVHERFVLKVFQTEGSKGLLGEWRRILSVPEVMVSYIIRFLDQLGRIIFIPILPLFLQELITSSEHVNSLTGLVIGVCSAATASFAVILGRIGDHIGHRQILIKCALICVCLFTLQSLVHATWQLLVLQALFGVALGGIVPGVSALLASHATKGSEGAVYGLDNSIISGARAIGPMLGVGIAMWFGFRVVFLSAAGLYLTAGILAVFGLPGDNQDAAKKLGMTD